MVSSPLYSFVRSRQNAGIWTCSGKRSVSIKSCAKRASIPEKALTSRTLSVGESGCMMPWTTLGVDLLATSAHASASTKSARDESSLSCRCYRDVNCILRYELASVMYVSRDPIWVSPFQVYKCSNGDLIQALAEVVFFRHLGRCKIFGDCLTNARRLQERGLRCPKPCERGQACARMRRKTHRQVPCRGSFVKIG